MGTVHLFRPRVVSLRWGETDEPSPRLLLSDEVNSIAQNKPPQLLY